MPLRVHRLTPVLSFAFMLAACTTKGGGDSGYSGYSGGEPESPYGAIELHNLSSATVGMVAFSPCDDPNWGANQLGGQTLPPGGVITFDGLNPDCYDIRAEDTAVTLFWEMFGFYVDAGSTVKIDLNP
jgi:hypothetical protein